MSREKHRRQRAHLAAATVPGGILALVGIGLLVAGSAGVAQAKYWDPGVKSVGSWFTGPAPQRKQLPSPAPDRQIWQFNSWRQTKLTVFFRARQVRLSVSTNGLFEEKWPYTRIVDTVLLHVCGIRQRGSGKALLDRMYGSKSRIKGEQLGGNAGRTFAKRTWVRKNGCVIIMTGKGARWHTVTTTIVPGR
jgi:hypothetical protein